MISCDNCGFGHKTVEELKACKPWSQIVTEAKERGEDVLGNPLKACECGAPGACDCAGRASVPQPRYEDENGKLWHYNPQTGEWDIPFSPTEYADKVPIDGAAVDAKEARQKAERERGRN